MQKTKKQLLGLAGLAAVGIMTAVAYGMPAPDAAAIENNDVTVNVQVFEGNPSVSFASPQDGSATTDPIVNVVSNYSQAKEIGYYLTYVDDGGKAQRVELPSFTPTEASGVNRFTIDVAPYGFREYELHTVLTGFDDVTREADIVTFSYSAAAVDPEQGVDTNGDPILSIDMGDTTERVVVAVYDKDGNPAFIDESGNPVTIELNRSDIDPATGKILITLPFEKYHAKPGTYTAVVSAYDLDDKLLSMYTVQIDYYPSAPVTPDTPNTGMLSIGDLNISRIDYLVTGLIAFGIVVGFAVTLVFRKSHR